MFTDAIEEPHGVVLHHDIVGGERLLDFIHPPLDDISTALTAEMLRGEEGGITITTSQSKSTSMSIQWRAPVNQDTLK